MSRTIEEEQEDFNSQLPELMKTNSGKFVVFKDGVVVAALDSYMDAYAAGARKFGREVFLIDQVAPRGQRTSALTWASGALTV